MKVKRDLFGPVVSACVIADGDMVKFWIEKGIRDKNDYRWGDYENG